MPNSRHSCWQLAIWEVVRTTGNLMPFKCIIYYCPSHHKWYIYKEILKTFHPRRKTNPKNKLPPVCSLSHAQGRHFQEGWIEQRVLLWFTQQHPSNRDNRTALQSQLHSQLLFSQLAHIPSAGIQSLVGCSVIQSTESLNYTTGTSKATPAHGQLPLLSHWTSS